MSGSNKQRATSRYRPRATSSTATYLLAGLAVVVIAAVVIGGIVWNATRTKGTADIAALDSNASISVGAHNAAHTIDVFEDFQCPICKEFEAQAGEKIQKAVADGNLRVRYHLLTFLNPRSGSGDYSSRAAGAALCLVDRKDVKPFIDFHAALFAHQPPEGRDDPDNAGLAALAATAGVSQEVQQCIASGAKVNEANTSAKQSTKQLEKALNGPAATPSVLSEGQSVDGIGDGTGWLDKLLNSHT